MGHEQINKILEGNRVALYVRVSTDDQHSSVDNQQQLFLTMIKNNGWVLHNTYTDEGFSGTKSHKRKFYQQLLEDGRNKKYDILLAKSYSRFARNQRESLQAIAELMEAGIRIIFLEDNLDSKKDYGMFGLFGWLAEQEARATSHRLKTIWKGYDEIGKIHVPKPSYGYSWSVELQNFIVIPEEKEVVLSVFKMYLEGMGCRGIANLLNTNGVPTQKGVKWSQPQIANMVTNHAYIGCLIQGKSETIDVTMKKSRKRPEADWKVHQDHHEAIISTEMFYLAQEENKVRSTKVSENGRPVRHSSTALFSTVVKCKHCGSTCTVKRQKHFRNYAPYYACINYEQHGKKGCGHERVSIFEDTLIQLLKGEINKLVETDYSAITEAFVKVKDSKKPKDERGNLKITEELITEKGNLSMTLLTAYSKGIIGESQFRLQNEMIEKDLKSLFIEVEELKRKLNTVEIVVDKEDIILRAINKLATVDSSMWTNQMIKAVMSKIVVDKDKNVELFLGFQKDVNIAEDEIAVTCDERCDVCPEYVQDKQCRYFDFNWICGYI